MHSEIIMEVQFTTWKFSDFMVIQAGHAIHLHEYFRECIRVYGLQQDTKLDVQSKEVNDQSSASEPKPHVVEFIHVELCFNRGKEHIHQMVLKMVKKMGILQIDKTFRYLHLI